MFESAGISVEERRQVETLYGQFNAALHPALNSLFQNLNREQIAALAHPLSSGQPLLIIAGAGSGKTSVLTRRVALLLLSGIPCDKIFVSTFTVKAAGEMKDRIGKLIQSLAESAAADLKAGLEELLRSLGRAWIGTFHSLCLRMLKEKDAEGFSAIEEFGYPPAFQILADADARKIIKDITQNLSVQADAGDLTAAMDLAANELLTPEGLAQMKIYAGLPAELIAEAWAKYAEEKRSKGVVDFTDLLYLAATAFADRRRSAEKWKARFTHVLIDEYQDTNIAQYAVATELAAACKNLFVVGDDDQSIYRFRGADVRNIRAFTQDYPTARVVRLIRNYRSTPIILGAANAILADRPASSTDKTLLASAPDDGKPPEKIMVYEASDETDEMNFVVFQIRELLNEGFQYKDIVIFYRVHELSETVGTALRTGQIPFVEVGGRSLTDHVFVKSVRAILASVNLLILKREGRFDVVHHAIILRDAIRDVWRLGKFGPMSRQDRSMLMGVPAPEQILLSDQGYVEAVQACQSGESQRHLELLWTAVHGGSERADSLTPRELFEFLMDTLGVSAASGDGEIRNGLVLFRRFLSSRLPFAAPGRMGLDQLLTAVQSSERGESIADLMQENVVRLLTVHASKGLEFPVVFVIGVEEDILPFVMPGAEETAEERLAREEEELRLFYVAITRAKQRLVLTGAAERHWYGRQVTHRPSRFLAKMPKEVVTRGSALSSVDRAAHHTRQFFKDLFGA